MEMMCTIQAASTRLFLLLKTKYCEVQKEVQEEINLPLIKSTMKDIVPLTLTDIPTNRIGKFVVFFNKKTR